MFEASQDIGSGIAVGYGDLHLGIGKEKLTIQWQQIKNYQLFSTRVLANG